MYGILDFASPSITPTFCTFPRVAMIDLESKFEVLETEVKEINTNKETLKKNLLDLIELQHILDKTRGFFQEVQSLYVFMLLC